MQFNVYKYIKQAAKFPILSRSEEEFCVQSYQSNAPTKKLSFDKLINSNLFLVIKIARKYSNDKINLYDLVQEGNIGLIVALDKFDTSKNVRFTTYAGFWIKAYMLNYIFKNLHSTKIGSSPRNRKLFWKLRQEQTKLLKAEITTSDVMLSKQFDTKVDSVTDMDAYLRGDMPLDDLLSPKNEQQSYYTYSALRLNTEEEIEKRDYYRYIQKKISNLTKATKDQRNLMIIEKRIMAEPEEEMTLEDIGKHFGISREYVRKMEERLLGRIKNMLI